MRISTLSVRCTILQHSETFRVLYYMFKEVKLPYCSIQWHYGTILECSVSSCVLQCRITYLTISTVHHSVTFLYHTAVLVKLWEPFHIIQWRYNFHSSHYSYQTSEMGPLSGEWGQSGDTNTPNIINTAQSNSIIGAFIPIIQGVTGGTDQTSGGCSLC